MPGQTTVTIDGKQWTVSVATTIAELAAGLSGVASMPAGTGILFDLGSDRSLILVNMNQMLFPLDIVFINSTAGVVGVLHGVQPGDETTFQASTTAGARYFLEVNAGEAEDVEVGDSVDLGSAQATNQLDLDTLMGFMITMMIVVMMMKVMTKELKPAVERPLIYGPRGEVLTGHQSIHGPERQELVDEFGTWAVGRAESVCPEDDVACVRREAGRLIYAYRRGFTG